jgi:membrane associated rhomboid family serine protease
MNDLPSDPEQSFRPTASEVEAVAACLARAQRILLAGGYRYIDGDATTWPLSPVLMAKSGLLMLGPALGDSAAALDLAARHVRGLRQQGADLRGLILVGHANVPDAALDGLYRLAGVSVAYLNAAAGSFQARRKTLLLDSVPAAMQDCGLETFLDPSADARGGGAGQDLDCRQRLAEAQQQIREVRQFQAGQAAAGGSGRPYGTYAILAVCTGVFLAMLVTGVNVMDPSQADLLAWGAKSGPLIKAGQWWRLGTSIFLHIGLIHIALNMYAAWIFGRVVERFQGTWRMLAFFLFGGMAGSVASLWWAPDVISAGASGGLFGIIGGMIAIYARYWRSLPPVMRRGLRSWLTTLLVLNAAFLLAPGIDSAAHIGGLVGGLLMGLAVARPPTEPRGLGPLTLVAAGTLLAALAVAAIYAIRLVPG